MDLGWGRDCVANDSFKKSLALKLISAESGETLAEARSVFASELKGFNDKTYFALCSAAFHDYPHAIRSQVVAVVLPD